MEKKEEVGFIEKLSTIIVDKRTGFILIYMIACIFCLFTRSWVDVNDDITKYLSEDTETRQGLNISEDEFTTYGMASVMVSNITYEKAEQLEEQILMIPGVNSISFDGSAEHFKAASALFSITFDKEKKDQETVEAMDQVSALLEDYDTYVHSEITEDMAADLEKEIKTVLVIAVFIILGVLLFTSKTYMEIPVLVLTFGVAALLNMGTHFIYGEISFISNSIAIILQLALAIDYAIILCHRFTEERQHFEAREAAIQALSKAIPEISSSSLTTISSLMALMFMQFEVGFDMGMVLIKALVFSLLVVFTLMPGLLMIFSGLMDKTVHKNFVPDISIWGAFVGKTRYIIPPIFIVILIGAFYMSNQTNYVFGDSTITTFAQNKTLLAEKKIKTTFGDDNIMAVVIPSGDYEKEAQLLAELESYDMVTETVGLANTEARDGYMVADKLTPRQFAELTDMDIEVAEMLYGAYAVHEETYSKLINGLKDYSVPLIDMFMYLYDQKEEGYVTLDEDLETEINDLYEEMSRGKNQLESEKYTRLLLITDLPEEGEATFDVLEEFHETIDKYYEEAYIVGASTSDQDLATFFAFDNVLISVLSALFVMLILLFTFKSAGLPVLLVLTIQGSIWINFSFPPIMGTNIFFLSYLVVTSIQMGATIDYAIVITSRYMELKKSMGIKEAMTMSLNQAFPTIITSGTILASAGILIGFLSSNYAVGSIGVCLGRGTIISLILVLGVLPQTLLMGDTIIEKTAFVIKRERLISSQSGNMKINGKLQGYVNGYMDANVTGTIRGNVKGFVNVGKEEEEHEEK
ncbi:MMPL family transporter [Gottschalkiaceae bacterium SANA]|nr:MMPL family transporter [Gottschalkiaceae bacterium SANA]